MNKRLINYLKSIFRKRIIEEEKVLKVIKKAHKKEDHLLNKLFEENCDNDYIVSRITETMKTEIEKGIKKLFPNQKMYFDLPITEEVEEQNVLDDGAVIEQVKKKKFSLLGSKFKFHHHNNLTENTEEQDDAELDEEIKQETQLLIDELNLDIADDVAMESEYWVINALSGYKNDRNRIPNYCTSLCFVKNNEIYFSAVFDWYRRDIYHAIKGEGAFMNNRKIRVSQNKSLEDSIIAFRIGAKGLSDNVELQKAITPLALKMQSFSNVAIEMCFVASGKIDGCVDVAVTDVLNYKIGKLIVTEAGGTVTDFAGDDYRDSHNILVTNGYIHSSMQKIVKSKLLSSTIKKVFKISKTALKVFLALA